MAEHRAIKSAIWDDTWFGRLSPFEMTVWIGLFSKCADDQGRFQDDAALIRSKLFPFQDVAVSSIEGALEAFDGHVIRYKKGERIAQLVRWFDNQPMQYAVPSNFPPPDGWVDRYRTNYKKVNVIWNWGEMENSPAGILLWQGLSTLQRPSSWTTYLGRLNSNPNPIPNYKKETNNKAAADPNFLTCEDPNAYKIVAQLMGWVTISQTPENVENLRNISAVALHHKADLLEYLTPFVAEWKRRYPSSSRLGWSEWAVTGKIPAEKKPGAGAGGSYRKQEQYVGPNGEVMEL